MSTQYLLLTNMLKLLRGSDYNGAWLSRIECLIYRLKLILLTGERQAQHDLDRYCPVEVIQYLNRLLGEANASLTAGAVVPQVEEELARLIQQMEAGFAPTAAPGAGQPRSQARIPGGAGPLEMSCR